MVNPATPSDLVSHKRIGQPFWYLPLVDDCIDQTPGERVIGNVWSEKGNVSLIPLIQYTVVVFHDKMWFIVEPTIHVSFDFPPFAVDHAHDPYRYV